MQINSVFFDVPPQEEFSSGLALSNSLGFTTPAVLQRILTCTN